MSPVTMGEVIPFEVTGARWRLEDQAARYALGDIVPEQAGDDDDERAMNGQRWLLKANRRRVRRLQSAGWHAPQDATNWKYIYNCPPVGVVTSRRYLRSCQVAPRCPFCWCRRYVYTACEKLDHYYYGPDMSRRTEPRPNHLLLVTWATEYPAEDWTLQRIFNEEITTYRRYIVDRIGAEGAFQLITLSPPDAIKWPYWSLSIRLLAVMPASGYTVPDLGEDTHFYPCSSPNRDVLASAIGRACAYPKQLFCGSIKESADLANFYDGFGRGRGKKIETRKGGTQHKGFRMLSTYGDLRHS